jgi:putative methyltransferase (TIGR04325 family)
MRGAPRGIRNVGRVIKRIPAFRAWRERRYEDLFVSDEAYGYFRGVFDTFEQAVRSSPPSKAVGFDLPQYARMFDERHAQVFTYDYPVLFWLKSILAPESRIFDLGGHVGVQFYSYQKYLTFPVGLRWRVCDVPAVVEQGRVLSERRGESERLAFTTSFSEAEGFDVFIAAGSLQFVESPSLAQSIERLSNPPKHLLLNKLPLRDGPGFVTLQNAGTSFVPQHVFERRSFIEDLTRLGYEVIDQWEDLVHSCHVPFHPDRAVPRYSGLYLRRASTGSDGGA